MNITSDQLYRFTRDYIKKYRPNLDAGLYAIRLIAREHNRMAYFISIAGQDRKTLRSAFNRGCSTLIKAYINDLENCDTVPCD